MPSVSRERVIEAVREYGLAWTTQDSNRIGRLFTEDAVYVERCFDKRATFRGRSAIEKYWEYQIRGKQSNICFRHVESEMVRDADKPIAVVKWLAEFDNRREHRSVDKENKRVRFCQLAKLIFTTTDGDDDGCQKICYLEEYAQGMIAKSFRWPGIDASNEELWNRIRFEPPKPPSPVLCQKCGQSFPSRTKLFSHLQNTEEVYQEEDPQSNSEGKPIIVCVPKEKQLSIETVFLCISISYSSSIDDPNDRLKHACKHLTSYQIRNDTNNNLNDVNDKDIELTWAVSPSLASSAIVNVVTIRLKKTIVAKITTELLPKALNKALQMTKTPKNQNRRSDIDCKQRDVEKEWIMVHTAGIVDRPCSPQRRDFETYVAFVPWKYLQKPNDSNSNNGDTRIILNDNDGSADNNTASPDEKQQIRESTLLVKEKLQQKDVSKLDKKVWRRPIEETSAGKFIDAESARRLKHGARQMKNINIYPKDLNINSSANKCNHIKVRTSTMEEPMHHYCKISLSIKQLSPGYVERLVALLVAYARKDLEESNFLTALKDHEVMSRVLTDKSLCPFHIGCFPSDLVILLEPALTRYENKTKLKLCRNSNTNTKISEGMKQSIDEAEVMMLNLIQTRVHLLKRWISTCGTSASL